MADALSIQPGTLVRVEVRRRPSNAAALKTLRRVLRLDPEVKRELKRVHDVRRANERTKRRGGRDWAIRMPKPEVVKGEPGEAGTVLGTLPVLRDLASLERFVDVAPAS